MAPPKTNLGHPYKTHNGVEIFPVLYAGKMVGHGNYMAGQTKEGQLVKDATGKPIPYKMI